VRDLSELQSCGFPVYARGATPLGPLRKEPGIIGAEIKIGTLAISSGDFMVGDLDGVVAIPKSRISEVLLLCHQGVILEGESLTQARKTGLTKTARTLE